MRSQAASVAEMCAQFRVRGPAAVGLRLLYDWEEQMDLTWTARHSGRQLLVIVAGDIDQASYPGLKAEADDWASQGLDVVLDCSRVAFVDSMGLRVLVQLRQTLIAAGNAFVIATASESLTRVLELAGVQDLFDHAARP